jgi:trans-aconitate methyltransferase
MTTLADILQGGPRLAPRARLRLWQRWTGTPMRAVAAHVPAKGRVVDLGCGFGLFAALLAVEGPEREVVGVDLDASKVTRGHTWFAHLPNLRLHHGDLDEAALGACDAVVLYDVLHHLRPPLAAALLGRVWGALRPGGLLIVKENEVRPLWKHAVNVTVEHVAAWSGTTLGDPVRLQPVDKWSRLLADAGFRVRHAAPLPAREGFFVPHALLVAERA